MPLSGVTIKIVMYKAYRFKFHFVVLGVAKYCEVYPQLHSYDPLRVAVTVTVDQPYSHGNEDVA